MAQRKRTSTLRFFPVPEISIAMNARLPAATELPASTWPAHLQLRLEHRAGLGTRLVSCRHHGPLRIQRPFYPEGADCAHLYILHPPGGLVSGDDLAVDVQVAERAAALLTTPGAGRVYRARTAFAPARQIQRVQLQVDTGAALEWLPQPTIVFDGADVLLDLDIDLAAGANFAGWEILCLGRPASALRFLSGGVEQRWRIVRDGIPLLNDRQCIRGGDRLRDAAWGLQECPVYGTFVFAAPTMPVATIEGVRELIESHAATAEVAVTGVRGLLLLRYLGDSTESAQHLFEACWSHLRPSLLGRAGSRPRIWNT